MNSIPFPHELNKLGGGILNDYMGDFSVDKYMNRYQYKEIIKKTIKFKNEEGKNVSRTFIIRKSAYSDHYQFYFVVDKKKESLKSEVKQSRLFDNKEELNNFLFKKFSIEF